jgi:hypothetical protein
MQCTILGLALVALGTALAGARNQQALRSYSWLEKSELSLNHLACR